MRGNQCQREPRKHTLPSIKQLETRLLVLFDITKSYILIIWHRLEAKCFGNPFNCLTKTDKLYHHFIVTTKYFLTISRKLRF